MRSIKSCTLTLPFKLNVRWHTMYTTHTMCTIHTMYSTHKMCTILTMYFTHYSHHVPHTHHVLHTTCALFSSCTSHKCEPHTPCASFTPFSPLNAFVLVQLSDPMVDNRYQVQSFPNPAQQPQQVLFLLMMMAQIKFCSQKYRGTTSRILRGQLIKWKTWALGSHKCRAVASDTRDLPLESNHWQILFTKNCIEKRKMDKKRPGMQHRPIRALISFY